MFISFGMMCKCTLSEIMYLGLFQSCVYVHFRTFQFAEKYVNILSFQILWPRIVWATVKEVYTQGETLTDRPMLPIFYDILETKISQSKYVVNLSVSHTTNMSITILGNLDFFVFLLFKL